LQVAFYFVEQRDFYGGFFRSHPEARFPVRVDFVNRVVQAVEVFVEGEWLFEGSEDGVSGGESAEVRIILAGTHVVLADFGVVELAGEHEVVVEGAVLFEKAAEGVVCVHLVHVDRGSAFVESYYLADKL